MVNNFNKNIVNDTFNREYNEDQFKIFIHDLLPDADFTKEGQIQLPNEYREFIKSAKRICKYKYSTSEFDENVLTVLAVKLRKTTSVDRARTAQRNFVARYLNNSRNYLMDAALVAFYSEDSQGEISPDWRFSLVQMNYVTEIVEKSNGKKKRKTAVELTPAKRFSFLVGSSEDTHTAQSQFYHCLEKSSKGEQITLEDLVAAFDIEKVSKEFFEKYKELYGKLLNELTRLYDTDKDIKRDFDEHSIIKEDFAKKTMGQLVFLYFIQKKGWLGVPKDGIWGQGDKKFLRNVFEKDKRYISNYDNFFNDVLEHLFYEALAQKRENNDWFDRLNCRIPFLNGGLFEPVNGYEYEVTNLTIDNGIFKDIFDTFDLYNFTVKEDEPLEKEVAVDPEMLGKVFENLLPENTRKGNGAFYTPREIVHYMCQESLINYLYNKLNTKIVKLSSEKQAEQQSLFKKNKIKQMVLTEEIFEENFSREDISFLIRKGDSIYSNSNVKETMPDSIINSASIIDEALSTIKVCDPAIGSGAFPVGMMNEIVRVRATLSKYIGKPDRAVYDLKRNAIEKSIYGVDIDPGAVEIAKLRFWLSLVVDEENTANIKPLPNLDYKIMQGNSLITSYEGIDFDEIVANQPTEKQLDLFALKSEKITEKISQKQNEFLKTPYATKKGEIKQEIEDLIVELVKTKFEEKAEIEGKPKNFYEEKIRNFAQNKENRNFFPWKLFFADAFEEGGFDVVIANPPYIDSETMVNIGLKNEREYISKHFEWANGNWDIYIAFFEKGYKCLNNKGNMIFITPDKWLARPFGKTMREKIHKNIVSILFAGREIFESALVDSIITNISTKTSNINVKKYDGKIIKDKRTIDLSALKSPYTLDFIYSDNLNFINKIEEQPLKLFNLCECQSACATSDAYKLKPIIKSLSNENDYNDNLFKIINTGTIGKYYSKWATTKIKYLKDYYELPIVNKNDFYNVFLNSYSKKVCNPKLIIKGLTLLYCCLDEKGEYIPGKSTLVIQNNDKDILKIAMAIINSKLSIAYIKEKYSSASYNGGIGFNKDMLNNFPIPKIPKIFQSLLIDKVNQILNMTLTNDYETNIKKQEEVLNIEYNINLILYKLYNLTYDEVLVIDQDFSMSEEEYSNYVI